MRRLELAALALTIATLASSPPAQAQLVRDHDGQGLRSFHGQTSRIRRSFQSDAEARAVFKHILAVSGFAGMEDRIIVRASADTDAAEAFVEKIADKEERLIFYNAEFMASVARKDKSYWSMVAILAHEVGHHLRMHTVIKGRDHEFELEADYQAGYILRRMGATLEQTQAAFRSLGTDAATPTHPARAQRVQAATLGWNEGGSGPAQPASGPRLSEAAEAWGVTKDTKSVVALEAFIRHFGDTYYGDLAKERLAELKQAETAKQAEPAKKKADEDTRAKAEAERICANVEGISNLKVLTAMAGQHKGTPAAACIATRIEALRTQQVAVATPLPAAKPATPKPAEPVIGTYSPSRKPAPLTVAEERSLKAKDSFRECGTCPEMVVVPAGSFMMGSPESEKGRRGNEGPQRRVTIAQQFAVGKFEVTFAEWTACVEAGSCKHDAWWGGWGGNKGPVLIVSWNDITLEYLPWLSRTTGKTYRLLSEAEWEFAARAGSTTRFHFGNDERDLCTYGNVPDLTAKEKYKDAQFAKAPAYANCRDGHTTPAPAGSFRSNAFDLYDMHGNVWELVEDCWHDSYVGAPIDGSAWTSSCPEPVRVVRGGSWRPEGADMPGNFGSARRSFTSSNGRLIDIGFRVARTLD